MFIGISGIIGAGKTTLTTNLAKELNYPTYYEPVKENAYLTDFYADPKRWGAMMQFYLLAKRFEQHQQIVWNGQGNAVQDRTIYEDTIFAEMLYEDGLIDKRDYDTYIAHFNVMKRYLVYPDTIIYLEVSPEVAMKRIAKRGRTMETTITIDYLKSLEEGYNKFLDDMSQWTTVIRVDYNEYQPVEMFLKLIEQKIPQENRFFRSLRKI